MDGASYVVVFPTVFARGRMRQLALNIRGVLRARGQGFRSVRRDGDVILVDANDPVFASSAIGLLFGIDRVAIARRTGCDLESVASGIASVGGNLLLKGERFLVRVDGPTRGYVPKDAEIAATSEIIEKKSGLGARPGTEQNHDKVLYAHVTRKSAYVCIFTDEGRGGVPHGGADRRAVCAIYDEMSAVSCYETVKQGYDARIIMCYARDGELAGLVRAACQIIPRLAREGAELDFYRIPAGGGPLARARMALEIMLAYPERYVSLATSPLVFPDAFADGASRRVFEAGKIPLVPLAGVDGGMFDDAKEIGLGRSMARLERAASSSPRDPGPPSKKAVAGAMGSKMSVSVPAGPNLVHDILDSLG